LEKRVGAGDYDGTGSWPVPKAKTAVRFCDAAARKDANASRRKRRRNKTNIIVA
jgi:hypothetical protein